MATRAPKELGAEVQMALSMERPHGGYIVFQWYRILDKDICVSTHRWVGSVLLIRRDSWTSGTRGTSLI